MSARNLLAQSTDDQRLRTRISQRAQHSGRVPRQTRSAAPEPLHSAIFRTQTDAATRTGQILVGLDTCRQQTLRIKCWGLHFKNPLKVLARGGFGIVFRADLHWKHVAVKGLVPGRWTLLEIRRFLSVIFLCHLRSHPNLMQLVGGRGPLCIVMEFVSLGSLQSLLYNSTDRSEQAKISDGRIKNESCWVFWTE